MKEHPYWKGYSSSENGSVLGRKGSNLNPILHHTGYHVLTLRQDGKQKQVRLHRFIWECHKGEIPEGFVINHIDGNKINNKLSNLELVTPKENTQHAFANKLMRPSYGEQNSMSKLTNQDATEIIHRCLSGESNGSIAKDFGLHPNYVSLIRHKKRWRNLWKTLFN